jgi:excinuclease UvrABC nuclease subunit
MAASEKSPAVDFEPKLAALPAAPGCYVFRDAAGEALYVGKAKSLRSRVRSYFQEAGSDTRAFIPFLRKELADFETIVTATEKEAAILENSLIKERKPRYNVKLRDDKEYLSIRLSTEHAWPRLELVRRPTSDGARYFGPYHSATAARRTLHLVERHWKLRTCSDRDLASRKRPCLKFQIKRCDASTTRPATGPVDSVRILAARAAPPPPTTAPANAPPEIPEIRSEPCAERKVRSEFQSFEGSVTRVDQVAGFEPEHLVGATEGDRAM